MDFNIMEKIHEAINIAVDAKIKDLKINYCEDGLIIEVLTGGKYKVDIKGRVYTISSMNGQSYVVNDVVYVLIINGNWSEMKILCKK